MMKTHSLSRLIPMATILCLFAVAAPAETLPLKRAVQLALSHATASGVATANEQRAFASYQEARHAYIPQVTTGAGLGYSYGFPLSLEGSAPSLFNLVAQSPLFNPAQLQFQKAARAEWQASQLQSKDQRNAVIQDTVLTYAELSKWDQRLQRLQQDATQAQQTEQSVAARVKEGVDSPLDLNKSKLSAARVRLHIAEAQGSADVLRQHLAKLTGQLASTIQVESGPLPALPDASQEDDLSAKAEKASPAIQSAEQHAVAEAFRAKGEHRALLPQVDFAAQYALLARYNNYDLYYKAFQQNNATIGVNIRVPIFNFAQRSHAQAADADALKARSQVQAARNQVSEEALRAQRIVSQWSAAREVADLEYQVAQSGFEAMQTRIAANTGTLHQLDDARVQANERFLAVQDADFELQRARVALLRATGDLEKWALGN